MAVVTRYVNTASTAGGDGTTNATAGANRAYASLSEWEAAEQADLVTATDTHVVNCSGTAADTTQCAIAGWTTDGTYYVTINGDNTTGKWNTSAYRLEVSDPTNGVINNTEVGTRIYDMQVQLENTTANTKRGVYFGNPSYSSYIERSIVKGEGGDGGGGTGNRYGIQCDSTGGTVRIGNCLVYDFIKASNGGRGISTFGAGITTRTHNCTVDNCTTAYNNGGGTFVAKNCGATNYTTPFNGIITQTTCSSSAPTYIDSANDDYHLGASDTTWGAAGTDLSADADYAISDDIDGQTRSDWDIGMDEAEAPAGGATIPVGFKNTNIFRHMIVR